MSDHADTVRKPAPPLSEKRLQLLERLVAVHIENGEWETFVALLDKAGYDIRPNGIVEDEGTDGELR